MAAAVAVSAGSGATDLTCGRMKYLTEGSAVLFSEHSYCCCCCCYDHDDDNDEDDNDDAGGRGDGGGEREVMVMVTKSHKTRLQNTSFDQTDEHRPNQLLGSTYGSPVLT